MGHSVPPVFAAIEPELLVHSDWSKLPPPAPSWVVGRVVLYRAKVEQWSAQDWLIALTFASITVAIARQMIELVSAARVHNA